MQILLLATGETDKLRPLTKNLPTPMLPVANRPTMVYTIEMLARQGFKKIMVSLYHMGGSIEAYFGDGRRWGVEIEYVLQRDAWGTAGAIKWAGHSLTETCMILPADILIDLNIAAIISQHHAKKSAATVVLHQRGVDFPVYLDADNQLQLNEPTADSTPLYTTAVSILEPQAIAMIPTRQPFDLVQQLLPALVNAGHAVHGYQTDGYYNALTSFSAYQAAQREALAYTKADGHVLNSTARTLEARQIADNIWVGRNQVIHPSVRLAPPIYIGDNCQIGADVDIGPDVILGNNVVIDDGATVSQSVILDYTYVGKLTEIINRIVNKNLMIDVETAGYTEVANRHLLSEAHPNLIDSWLRRAWDTAVSTLLLLLTLPITLPIGLITWLTTGRIIVHQPYLGRHPSIMTDDAGLNTFHLYRFNTHRSNGDSTRFGRWLEKSDIYRLPELWNVLKGDMSLIGVKPLRPEETASIIEAWQQQRYQYPAGFTGLWYIQTDSTSDLDEILIADAYYVATRTKRGDMSLFWQTLPSWFRRLRN